MVDGEHVQKSKASFGVVKHEKERDAVVLGTKSTFPRSPLLSNGSSYEEPISNADLEITSELLKKIKPHQIYAAGDLSDPHGTHRTCLSVILQSCHECQDEDWYSDCAVWLYRGAWQEWAPHEIEMAVPLSPQEVSRKALRSSSMNLKRCRSIPGV